MVNRKYAFKIILTLSVFLLPFPAVAFKSYYTPTGGYTYTNCLGCRETASSKAINSATNFSSNDNDDEKYYIGDEPYTAGYLIEKITAFCSATGDVAKCKKYCKAYENKHKLCGGTSSNQPNIVNQKKIEEAKKAEELKRQQEEERKRQELERKENEIKENVTNIFQTEFEEKNQERASKINEVKNQSKIKTFFIGSNDRSIDGLRNEKVQIEIQLTKLNKILSETTNDENRTFIQEKINSFNDQKIAIEKTISENEAKAGIFGWVKNIFRFKY